MVWRMVIGTPSRAPIGGWWSGNPTAAGCALRSSSRSDSGWLSKAPRTPLPTGRRPICLTVVSSMPACRNEIKVPSAAPDAQRTIAGPGQFHGRSDDPIQGRVKVEIRGDPDDHLDKQLRLLAGGRQIVQLRMYLTDQSTVVGQP